MRSITVGDLKANLTTVLKEVEHGSRLNITSGGRIVARLVPPEHTRVDAMKRLRELAKTAQLKDVITPIDEQWEVEK